MRYLPIHIDTFDATICVIGAGAAAEAKLRSLIKTQAQIEIYAPDLSPEIARWVQHNLRLTHKDLQIDLNALTDMVIERLLSKASLVYAATENEPFNIAIANMARARNIPVNVADFKPACSFITPALVDRAPIVISIGSEGASPALSRALKSELESRLPVTLGKLARTTQKLRSKVKEIMPKLSDRQRFWAQIFDNSDLDSHLKLNSAQLSDRVNTRLEERMTKPKKYHDDLNDTAFRGNVMLVGAGPGDPDLLTLAARKALHSADVIVYDRLVSQAVLDLARREAEYIYVGKEAGGVSTPQNKINTILIEKARAGLVVIRLKSGDPLIFGRADEELEALQAENIHTDIIPGITSAAAAAAQIGRSLTARGQNKAISFLTGHDAKGFAEQDWTALSHKSARAAIYMGVGAARFIQGRLLLHGADKTGPITVVENASRDNQIIVSTTVANLPDDMAAQGIKGPAILLIGYAPCRNNDYQQPLTLPDHQRSAAYDHMTVIDTQPQSFEHA